MSEDKKPKDPATDKKPKDPAEAPPAPASNDGLVDAINNLANKDRKKEIPHVGPPPTDPDGNLLKPNCVFVERDGNQYEAIVDVDEDGVRVSKEIPATHHIKDDVYEKSTRKVYNLYVNFRTKKADNWKHVSGISEHKDLRNTFKKRYVIFK